MEVKVVVSFDDRAASLLEGITAALNGRSTVKKESVIASEEEKVKVIEPASKPVLGASKKTETVVEKKELQPVGLEEIRGIARQLADDGRQAEYREILKHYGYEKVNQIKEADYVRIYDDMLDLVEGLPF